MNTNGHYEVARFKDGWRADQINALTCVHCQFYVSVPPLHKAGDKSGAGRYCRARAKMVQHLHAEHREMLNVQGYQPAVVVMNSLQARSAGAPGKEG